MPALRRTAAKKAKVELRAHARRLAELARQTRLLGGLVEMAPVPAAWPTDIRELADKIEREQCGGLRSFERPVRNCDRQLVMRNLPRGIEVARNDPQYA